MSREVSMIVSSKTARRWCLLALAMGFSFPAFGQEAAGRLVVFYRGGSFPANAETVGRTLGARSQRQLPRLGITVMSVAAGEESAVISRLRMRPEVETVLQDRLVTGNALAAVRPVSKAEVHVTPVVSVSGQHGTMVTSGYAPHSELLSILSDVGYLSAAGWAVRAAGGFGANVAGGNSVGPWNVNMGAGTRIAVLDSGVDAAHPDLAPNLAVNLTEVDQSALPSVCDDGSPQDQQGHGTWAASLAAGAYGPSTGEVVGVAPQATLINIKVLERMPGAGNTPLAQCEAGQTGGLLSWVLTGIDDALAQHADVITLSLGTLVDLTTGDGAGWKTSFDRVTYAATQAGAVIVAAAGNDGLDLSSGRYAELPAQARGVLAVTASTNPACAENLLSRAVCLPGNVTRPYYSNYGIAGAVAAPGGSYPAGSDMAVSGWIFGACSAGLPNTQDGLPANGASLGCFGNGHVQYVQAMGTSASAPLVAGEAALLRAAHRDWTAAQIVAAIQGSATPTAGMTEPVVNLAGALQQ